MTKDEALTLALEALEGVLDDSPKVLDASISGGLYEVVQCRDAITAIKEALAQPPLPVQEPVAWGVFEGGNLHDMYFTEEDAQELARLKGTHAEVRPLYTTPPLPEERNFCPRCGKRLGLGGIHTCTPPQEKNT